MLRTLLIWGLFAGLVAGVCAFGVAKLAGEPPLDQAIAYEEANAEPEPVAAPGAHHEAEGTEVSRGTQSTIGLLTGTTIYAVSFGGLFAIVFALVYGRIADASPRITAMWLGFGAWVCLFFVPFAKYPSTPPAIGDPETIDKRTLLYVGMMVIALLAAYIGVRVRAWLLTRRADVATLGGFAAFFVIVFVTALALPGLHEIPADFPPTELWAFRVGSFSTQVVLWAVLTTVFAYSAQRAMTRAAAPARAAGSDTVGARA